MCTEIVSETDRLHGVPQRRSTGRDPTASSKSVATAGRLQRQSPAFDARLVGKSTGNLSNRAGKKLGKRQGRVAAASWGLEGSIFEPHGPYYPSTTLLLGRSLRQRRRTMFASPFVVRRVAWAASNLCNTSLFVNATGAHPSRVSRTARDVPQGSR